MMLFKELFSSDYEIDEFTIGCLSGVNSSVAFPKANADLGRYAKMLLLKYSNKIVAEFIEEWFKTEPLEDFKTMVQGIISSNITYSCNKIISAWERDYNAIANSEMEDWSGYAYNSNTAQPTSSRVKETQKANQQQAILDELELRKKSIIDFVLQQIIDQITLKIY